MSGFFSGTGGGMTDRQASFCMKRPFLRSWRPCLTMLALGFLPLAVGRPSLSQSGRPLPARARHGMVASSSALASQVGVDVLKRGGNAADAAAAVGLALAVTYPYAGNLGGGGFMVLRMADG